jgi:hypothetical protein
LEQRPLPGDGGGPHALLVDAVIEAADRGFWSRRDPSLLWLLAIWRRGWGLCGADLHNSVELHPATSRRGAAVGENRALTPVRADDGSVFTPSPC